MVAGSSLAAAATGAVGAGNVPFSRIQYWTSVGTPCTGVITLPNGSTVPFNGVSSSSQLQSWGVPTAGTLVAGDRQARWLPTYASTAWIGSCENAAYGAGTSTAYFNIAGQATVVTDDNEPAVVGTTMAAQIAGQVSYQRIGSTTILSMAGGSGTTTIGNQSDTTLPLNVELTWLEDSPGYVPGTLCVLADCRINVEGTYSQATPISSWAVGLTTTSPPATTSSASVSLEAVASRAVSGSTVIELVDQTTNTTVQTCSSTQFCTRTVTQTVPAGQTSVSHTYVARVRDAGGVQALSNPITVVWTAQPWVVTLAAAPPVAPSGTAIILEAAVDRNPSPEGARIEIVNQDTGGVLQTCTSVICSTTVTKSTGAGTQATGHYIARVVSSNGSTHASSATATVTWVAPPWAVSLEAVPPVASSGMAVTLAAEASRDVAVSGARIDIVDQANGSVLWSCTSGQTCTTTVTKTVPNGQTSVSGTYLARVVDSGGIEATSAAIPATWATTTPAWAVALVAAPPAAPSGQSVTLGAAANADVGTAGARIEIVDQTAGGAVIKTCTTGQSCTTSVSQTVPSGQTSVSRNYIARVMSASGSTLATSAAATTVAWTNTTPPPPPWEVALVAAPPATASGQAVFLVAVASREVSAADATIEIVEQSTGEVVGTATSGQVCSASVTQLVPAEELSTSATYVARVVSGTTTLTTSTPSSVVWAGPS
jgi:hypothetical protein